MKHRYLLALSLFALILAGCTKPAPNTYTIETETSVTETTVTTTETTTAVTSATEETTTTTEITTETKIETGTTVSEQSDPVAEKIWAFLSTYESKYTTDLYFLFDFNGDDFPEVAFVGWDMLTPYMNVYDLSGSKPVSLGGTSQGLSPYSDDKECIGLYCNEKGKYFYHSLEHYVMPNYKLNGSSIDYYCFSRHIIPVDFDNHTVEFSFEGTEWKGFDNEYDAEKYKERIFKELEQLTLVTELKTSYMVEDRDDEEAFRAMLADLPKINYVTK